jgi:hypothetical protein
VVAGAALLWYALRAARGIISRQLTKTVLSSAVEGLLRVVLIVYLLFNMLWGLNYNRQGIAAQLGLAVAPYETEELTALVRGLQERICRYGDEVNVERRARLNNHRVLLRASLAAYERVYNKFPYLRYGNPSVKPSLLSPLGPYVGFTGYYNPFTAEAQINTAVPFFVKPFVVAHEMAHQLGYAKESEANFVSYLVLRAAADPELRYSVYFEMHAYALAELRRRDPLQALLYAKTVHPRYREDGAAYLAYLDANKNGVEPFISGFYDRFLKMNNQPAGKASYNLVVAWLIAYMKKYGPNEL